MQNNHTNSVGSNSSLQGQIFDIKQFAVHDGPGIRTTVFLKGCPLRCAWCHNPEAISPRPELMLYAEKCIACAACLEACAYGAHELQMGDGNGQAGRVYHRDRCDLSGQCVETCYAEALVLTGREVSVEEVMVEVRKDAAFYRTSGGGVTLSGGEPLLQADFSAELLRQCRAEDLHTALDTCGQAPWRAFEMVLPHLDLVLYDIKQLDPQIHRRYTGVSNSRILDNLRRLSACSIPIEIRMPIIPTVNDTRRHIDDAAELLASLDNITAVRLLPYHRLAGSKYARLDRVNTLPDVESPKAEYLQEIAAWIHSHGLHVLTPESA